MILATRFEAIGNTEKIDTDFFGSVDINLRSKLYILAVFSQRPGPVALQPHLDNRVIIYFLYSSGLFPIFAVNIKWNMTIRIIIKFTLNVLKSVLYHYEQITRDENKLRKYFKNIIKQKH